MGSDLDRASGLIDEDGYFWRSLDLLAKHMVPEAAEAELRAQVERALEAGINPTHVDAHMAAAMLPGLLAAHIAIGRKYGLFPVLPRSIRWAPEADEYARAISELDLLGLPVVDHCRGTVPVEPDVLPERWRTLVEDLPPGLTHFALHCTMPSDSFATLTPQHAVWRFAEYELIASGFVRDQLAAAAIEVIGTRELQRRWQSGEVTGVDSWMIEPGQCAKARYRPS